MIPSRANLPLVLASASRTRAHILENAGVAFTVDPADIDETAIRGSLDGTKTGVTASDMAVVLAQTKASVVSQRHPEALVVGADQVLVCDGELFTKPHNKAAARDQLLALRGKTHSLVSAVACARSGSVDWYHEETVRLTMREFSNDFLGTYLAAVGSNITASVGGYQIEGPGIQLFAAIEGDYFTVLGLPLIPLLDYLRTRNGLQE